MKLFALSVSILLFSCHVKAQTAADLYDSGMAKIALKDYHAALIYFDKSIQLDPYEEKVYFSRARTKELLKEHVEAIKDYNKTLTLNSKNEDAYLERGMIKQALNDFYGAMEDYDRVIELNPKHEQAYYSRGYAKYRTNDREAACSDWQIAKKLGYQPAREMIATYCLPTPR